LAQHIHGPRLELDEVPIQPSRVVFGAIHYDGLIWLRSSEKMGGVTAGVPQSGTLRSIQTRRPPEQWFALPRMTRSWSRNLGSGDHNGHSEEVLPDYSDGLLAG
jgi:hypothetical protein